MDGIEALDFTFRAVDDEGAYCRYDALFSVAEPGGGRVILVYADSEADEGGEVSLYASVAADPSQLRAAQDAADAGAVPRKPPVVSLAPVEDEEGRALVARALDEVEGQEDGEGD